MPPQLLRLVLLTLLIVGTYGVARVALTPPTFGQYGHYRGGALQEAAERKPLFAGTKACNECHDEVVDKLAKDRHKTVGCESCHGPSRVHAQNPDLATTKPAENFCVRCHLTEVARPAKQKQIVLTEHFPGDRCIECHVAHQPNKSK
jgi:predicted CXXCH cytochrome family protein